MAKSEFCVIGLGRFGMQVAKSLVASNHNVILIDNDEEKVNLASKEFEYVFKADATDLNTLEEINLAEVNTIIVSVSNIESSIMISANLKELKIKNIVARAKNLIHKRVLNTIGVREAIIPEEVVANNIALKVIHKTQADIFSLNKSISIVKTNVSNPNLFEKKLSDINIRLYAGANVISIQRQDQLIFPVDADTILMQADSISVVCKSNEIDDFLNFINPSK
ncbi:potassium channel family protein [Mycoplasmoides alvi]|uniref:potassium channel family protein n=1 Tax=Mycoplasmoides alvi TaxID=78580 RepID=UPI00051C9A78|nr:TrkA family potassium uptake protein [Mycoplasmoides alvi]